MNEFFASVYTEEHQGVPDPNNVFEGPEHEMLADIEITEDAVKKKLEALDPSKAAGPDGIPSAFLQPFAAELIIPYLLV